MPSVLIHTVWLQKGQVLLLVDVHFPKHLFIFPEEQDLTTEETLPGQGRAAG